MISASLNASQRLNLLISLYLGTIKINLQHWFLCFCCSFCGGSSLYQTRMIPHSVTM